jgi:hypothetical protein
MLLPIRGTPRDFFVGFDILAIQLQDKTRSEHADMHVVVCKINEKVIIKLCRYHAFTLVFRNGSRPRATT